MPSIDDPIARRQFVKLMALGSAGLGSTAFVAGCMNDDDEESAARSTTTEGGKETLRIANDEYVYLSIVTQVPFWVDHKAALADFGKETGAKTSFIGPPDFDVPGQAHQLDELVARKPAGIILFIGDADAMTPGINRAVEAGRVGAELLAEAIGGKGEVILGTFPSPNVLDRVKGYRQYFKEKHPEIKVVQVVNDKADPSYAPDAYAAAIAAHPNVVGIGGTDGDSGLGAARAVKEAGKADQIKIVAMDRNDDMLAEVENGPIVGSVVQKSYDELWLACWMLYWLNHEQLKPVPDWEDAGINPLPEKITTGVWKLTRDNVGQFKH